MNDETGVIIVGAGLAGLVAAAELVDAGRRVIILEQEPEASLGGQAFWSFGGLFLVNSPEQRRLGVKDSHDLALQDWMGSAGFDREEDLWPRRWAEAYVDFASGEKYAWLRGQGYRALEGTFLGGCLFSGRVAGRAVAQAVILAKRAALRKESVSSGSIHIKTAVVLPQIHYK